MSSMNHYLSCMSYALLARLCNTSFVLFYDLWGCNGRSHNVHQWWRFSDKYAEVSHSRAKVWAQKTLRLLKEQKIPCEDSSLVQLPFSPYTYKDLDQIVLPFQPMLWQTQPHFFPTRVHDNLNGWNWAGTGEPRVSFNPSQTKYGLSPEGNL